jgi:D-glycero-D-manno-heptose 1,7-bisphosphate phosphatase
MAPHPGVFIDPRAGGTGSGGPVLFLDRDGVINVDHGYVSTPSETQWVDGIFDLCRGAIALGYRLIVVTNQAGIARGYYTEAQFLEYSHWVHAVFHEQGADLLATVYCPHHPTAGLERLRVICPCRKPAPGMLIEASHRFNVDLVSSALVGDKPSDLEAGSAAGVGRLYLTSPTGKVDSHAEVWDLAGVLSDLQCKAA